MVFGLSLIAFFEKRRGEYARSNFTL